MINELRDQYLASKTQIVVIDKNGKILETDHYLFDLNSYCTIEDFHPFFSIISNLLEIDNKETLFSGVHLNYFEKNQYNQRVVDIIVNSGSKKSKPFIVVIDFTDYYNNFQSVAQEKNESVLNFHLEEIKNRQLQVEKEFKNKFLSTISHDLKSPIWGSNFFLSMLEKTSLSAEQTGYINTIKETNDYVFNLVEDLMDLSKIESGKMKINNEKINIISIFKQINKIYQPKIQLKKLNYYSSFDQNIPQNLIGDKTRINQIIMNLLDNSYKFTKKGSVTFNINLVQKDNKTAQLLFEIIDTGSGIKTKHKTDVYEIFKKLHKSKKIDGSGLGLTIVSNLVELMKGEIDYETKTNKGTHFKIKIPFIVA